MKRSTTSFDTRLRRCLAKGDILIGSSSEFTLRIELHAKDVTNDDVICSIGSDRGIYHASLLFFAALDGIDLKDLPNKKYPYPLTQRSVHDHNTKHLYYLTSGITRIFLAEDRICIFSTTTRLPSGISPVSFHFKKGVGDTYAQAWEDIIHKSWSTCPEK